MIKGIVQLLFTVYMLAVLVCIVGSYVPEFQNTIWMGYIAQYTDPYLNLCKQHVPLLGGSIDVSPLVALFSLYFTRFILVKIL
ncbi:MAG: YggT family protein [Simkaniaceae bacterium]|nr:YggT family protein [Simkaniaceae bacterium]